MSIAPAECPFCGGATRLDSFGVSQWAVFCGPCDCHLKPMNSPEEAVASWNRRAPTINPDDPALVERCIEVVEELSWTTESIDELTPEATEEIVKAVLAAITKGTT